MAHLGAPLSAGVIKVGLAAKGFDEGGRDVGAKAPVKAHRPAKASLILQTGPKG